MTIKEAIQQAKKHYDWCVARHEPTSVNVGFIDNEDKKQQTQFDVFYDHEKELEELWQDLHEEFEAEIDAVTYVEALGYIEE